jgi:hypothetical protein
MVEVTVSANVDYIMGHLRYGHYEGTLRLTEEEYQEFMANPVPFVKANRDKFMDDLELIVDDWSVEDVGDIYEVEVLGAEGGLK